MSAGSDESCPVVRQAAVAERYWGLRRLVRVGCIAAALTCFGIVGSLAWYVKSLGPTPLGTNLEFSRTVLDRDGRLLRAYATSEGRWRLPARVADVDPRHVQDQVSLGKSARTEAVRQVHQEGGHAYLGGVVSGEHGSKCQLFGQ